MLQLTLKKTSQLLLEKELQSKWVKKIKILEQRQAFKSSLVQIVGGYESREVGQEDGPGAWGAWTVSRRWSSIGGWGALNIGQV